MPDVREVYDMVTQKAGPGSGALQRQFRRQDRNNRNRKLGGLALAGATILAVALILTRMPSSEDGSRPANQPFTTPDAVPVPAGVQLVREDGSVQAPMTGLPVDAQSLDLSSDRSTITFTTLVNGTWQIATASMDSAGTDLTILTDGPGAIAPAFSPDGTQIAFQARLASGNDDLFIIDLDSGEVRRLTNGPLDESNPDWSPDGTRIVFARGSSAPSDVDGGSTDSEIWTVSADGTNQRRLTDDQDSDIEPAWSPDGTLIAFFHGKELWTIHSDGSRPRMLTRPDGGAWAPSWSPDGTQIVYVEHDPTEQGQFPVEGSGRNLSMRDAPLLGVKIIDVTTGSINSVPVRVVTDGNGATWFSDSLLLVNRWD
jgi:TolB protein